MGRPRNQSPYGMDGFSPELKSEISMREVKKAPSKAPTRMMLVEAFDMLLSMNPYLVQNLVNDSSLKYYSEPSDR